MNTGHTDRFNLARTPRKATLVLNHNLACCVRRWKVPSFTLCTAGVCRLLPIFKRQLSGLLSVSSEAFTLQIYLKSPTYNLPEVQQTKRATRGCYGAVIIQVYDSYDFLRQTGNFKKRETFSPQWKGRGKKKMIEHWEQAGKWAEEKFCQGKHKEQGPLMAWHQW